MTYSVGMTARMRGLRCLTLASVTLAAVSGCVPHIPEGHLACGPDSPCPPDWHCWSSDQTCHSSQQPPSDSDGSAPERSGPDGSDDAEPAMDAAQDGPPPIADPDGGHSLVPKMVDLPPPLGCVPAKAEEVHAIFVSPTSAGGESTDDCGSRNHPCASVNRGIERAELSDFPYVYLNKGTYAEQVELRADVKLVGGWNKIGDDWWSYCGDNPEKLATIDTPTHIGVSAEYDGEAALEVLSVLTKATAEPGETLYGVFARGAGTSLQLRRVRVEAAKGGDGGATAAGAAPEKPAMTCAVGSELPARPAGEPGQVAAAGSFDAEGYRPASGQPGQPGSPGDNAQERTQGCSDCVEAGSCARNAASVCAGTITGQQSCPTPGAPGCAGLPGRGGDGGQSGGGSIALFAWGARVEIADSLLIAGDGGAGALGAEGTPGGSGGDGGLGTDGAVCSICSSRFRLIDPMLPIEPIPERFAGARAASPAAADPEFVPGREIGAIGNPGLLSCATDPDGASALAGRSGTPGSAGGRGGDGAGGPSHALVRGGGAVLHHDDKTTLQHGVAGVSLGAGAPGAASDMADDGSVAQP